MANYLVGISGLLKNNKKNIIEKLGITYSNDYTKTDSLSEFVNNYKKNKEKMNTFVSRLKDAIQTKIGEQNNEQNTKKIDDFNFSDTDVFSRSKYTINVDVLDTGTDTGTDTDNGIEIKIDDNDDNYDKLGSILKYHFVKEIQLVVKPQKTDVNFDKSNDTKKDEFTQYSCKREIPFVYKFQYNDDNYDNDNKIKIKDKIEQIEQIEKSPVSTKINFFDLFGTMTQFPLKHLNKMSKECCDIFVKAAELSQIYSGPEVLDDQIELFNTLMNDEGGTKDYYITDDDLNLYFDEHHCTGLNSNIETKEKNTNQENVISGWKNIKRNFPNIKIQVLNKEDKPVNIDAKDLGGHVYQMMRYEQKQNKNDVKSSRLATIVKMIELSNRIKTIAYSTSFPKISIYDVAHTINGTCADKSASSDYSDVYADNSASSDYSDIYKNDEYVNFIKDENFINEFELKVTDVDDDTGSVVSDMSDNSYESDNSDNNKYNGGNILKGILKRVTSCSCQDKKKKKPKTLRKMKIKKNRTYKGKKNNVKKGVKKGVKKVRFTIKDKPVTNKMNKRVLKNKKTKRNNKSLKKRN